MEIRDGLSEKMENNNIYTFNHPNKSKGKAFMIQGVSDQFYKNLKAFIREPDVQVKHSILDAMIVDPVVYRSRPGMHYMPVTVRINKRAPKIAKRPRKCWPWTFTFNKRAPKPAKRPRTQANHGSAFLIAGMVCEEFKGQLNVQRKKIIRCIEAMTVEKVTNNFVKQILRSIIMSSGAKYIHTTHSYNFEWGSDTLHAYLIEIAMWNK